MITSLSGINSIPETFKNKFNAYSLAQVGKQVVFNGFKNDVRLQIYSMNGEEFQKYEIVTDKKETKSEKDLSLLRIF